MDGIHGWQFIDQDGRPVTVTVKFSGFYELIATNQAEAHRQWMDEAQERKEDARDALEKGTSPSSLSQPWRSMA